METSEKSFPFDSVEVDGKPDRVYVADDFARYFRAFISSGVFMKQSDNLQVMANGDMTVTLMPGSAIIDGYRYDNPKEIIIQLDPADGINARKDRISATYINEERRIRYTVQKGEPSYNPIAPECRRTADYKDYVLADITVNAGAISIGDRDIEDQREKKDLCGVAVPFAEIDLTTIFIQFTDWFHYVRQQGELDIEELIADLTDKSRDKYELFLADLRDFYRDIKSKGQQDYDDFNAEISAYIDELEDRGDSSLAAIIQQLINFRNTKESDFLELWENIRGQLETDPAGHLQNKIDALEAKLASVTEMLMTGRTSTKLITNDGDYITDDMGNALQIGWPICKCK